MYTMQPTIAKAVADQHRRDLAAQAHQFHRYQLARSARRRRTRRALGRSLVSLGLRLQGSRTAARPAVLAQ